MDDEKTEPKLGSEGGESIKLQNAKKHDKYQEILLQKPCVICLINDEEKNIICDNCDDLYHYVCLNPPIAHEISQDHQWVCRECEALLEQHEGDLQSEAMEYVCAKCSQVIEDGAHLLHQIGVLGQNQCMFQTVNIKVDASKIKCRFCEKYFHIKCFSHRTNSVNCERCESRIREKGPKSHEQFKQWLQKNREQVQQSGYLLLKPEPQSGPGSKKKSSLPNNDFKPTQPPGHWEQITAFEASLYYAITTCKLIYCNSQLYKTKSLMNLNRSENHSQEVQELCITDARMFKQFIYNFGEDPLACLEIRESRALGFYVVATRFIPSMTILCEYAGEVCTRKENIHHENDSIFSLIVSHFAKSSLDIAPSRFGNISRFVAGINKSQKSMQNVRSINFSLEGRSRIIFFSSREIECGETLYLDYNDGVYEEYPTDNFIA